MLVNALEQDIVDLPLGIIITQWEIDGEYRAFTLYPYKSGVVFVGNVAELPIVISEPKKDWGPISNGFGDNAQGYPYSAQARQDLYDVWDNPWDAQKEAAQRLYINFKHLIEAYRPEAEEYLENYLEKQYQDEMQAAKNKGWDTHLISRLHLKFPY